MVPSRAGVAVAVTVCIVAAGLVARALGAIDEAATATEPADRGTASRVGETLPPPTSAYRVPVREVGAASWTDSHASYPATDIFLRCGAVLVSPVDGVVSEVRRIDRWDPVTDDPADRGGRTVSIIGNDGVRYYLAHFDTIDTEVTPQHVVAAGDRLGTMGETGRTSACHLHFAISPPCPQPEWSVRRGVIWPAPYLDAWRRGEPRSPVDEVAAWSAANPTVCSDAAASAMSNRDPLEHDQTPLRLHTVVGDDRPRRSTETAVAAVGVPGVLRARRSCGRVAAAPADRAWGPSSGPDPARLPRR